MRPIDANALASEVKRWFAFPGNRNTMKKAIEHAKTLDYVPRQQWISVKDDLPACGVSSVLVCYEDGIVVMADWSHDILGNWWFYTDGEYDIDEITHWMPLPEPPKEGRKDA